MADQPQIVPVGKPVIIRQVWSHNLDHEFSIIRQIIHRYRVVSMDTEFPGVVFVPTSDTPAGRIPKWPHEQYWFLKKNVDALKLIQVGLTFTDARGNLPHLGSNNQFVWEFNFRDFDPSCDPHSPESIALLRRQGIDFERNQNEGVDCARFAYLLRTSGLLFNPNIMWVTFHSAYDFGYLIKIVIGRALPWGMENFLGLVRLFFGFRIFDMKHMIRFCNGLKGGLERVARTLEVERTAGKCHQAGSDSLLTWHTFQRMAHRFFINAKAETLAGVLYGLEVEIPICI
ncbi:hypothetical protein SAY86_009093 [Trapa natans]|uniref:poly(A)-specific ribonuclease n=1 Tax=Trapa natans TaxID=22666 RepID=A0AAN7QFA4_TRANT|nr:hypothetical protein SAY86_008094 [Trapa natans]KAK4763325.1 hypothetical protein SAY86_009093 [Trapa natans]